MIVITAPTSNIGHRIVADLVGAGQPLRLVARDPGKLPVDVRARVEIVEGSHGDPDVIDRALDGADAVFWLVPPNPRVELDEAYLDFTRPAAASIRKHGVGRVVSLTALGRGTRWADRAGLVTASIGMDDVLMETGAAFRGLAMPSFMDNVARQATAIGERGEITGPLEPDRRAPTTAARDVATLAASLLSKPDWTGQEGVPVLGPEDLSQNEMAAIATEALGRAVHYRQVSWEDFESQVRGMGMTRTYTEGYVEMFRAKDEGMDNVAAGGRGESRTATTFRQWCEEELKPLIKQSR